MSSSVSSVISTVSISGQLFLLPEKCPPHKSDKSDGRQDAHAVSLPVKGFFRDAVFVGFADLAFARKASGLSDAQIGGTIRTPFDGHFLTHICRLHATRSYRHPANRSRRRPEGPQFVISWVMVISLLSLTWASQSPNARICFCRSSCSFTTVFSGSNAAEFGVFLSTNRIT